MVDKAITAIKQALAAQPAPVQEPVAYEYGEEVYWHTNPALNDYIRANGKALVYATPLAAQPVVQPVAIDPLPRACNLAGVDYQTYLKIKAYMPATPPAAQPAVPDAFGTREGEHPQYIQGWNDCRAEMLKGMKP
jgi:hypothetical protein